MKIEEDNRNKSVSPAKPKQISEVVSAVSLQIDKKAKPELKTSTITVKINRIPKPKIVLSKAGDLNVIQNFRSFDRIQTSPSRTHEFLSEEPILRGKLKLFNAIAEEPAKEVKISNKLKESIEKSIQKEKSISSVEIEREEIKLPKLLEEEHLIRKLEDISLVAVDKSTVGSVYGELKQTMSLLRKFRFN